MSATPGTVLPSSKAEHSASTSVEDTISTKGEGSTQSPSSPEMYHGERGIDVDEEMEHIAQVRSRYSVKEIYGDLDENQIEATRQKTRETVLSLYHQQQESGDGAVKDSVNADGHELTAIDPEIVTWEGEDDPANPRNWTKRKRGYHVVLASLFTFLASLTSSVISPAVDAIMADYHNSNSSVGIFMVSIILLSWALFVPVFAPMSEILGRRYIILGSLLGGLVFNIACAVAPNTAAMLIFRFLTGAFNGAPIAVAAGTIADLYDEKSRNWPMALFNIGPSVGPAIAPLFAGFLVQYKSWHWVFWVTSMITGAVLILGVLFFEETYSPVLLARKASKLRKQTGNQNLHTIWQVANDPFLVQLRNAVVRPILFLTTNPIIFALGLHTAFIYGFLYLILVSYPSLWTDKYHYSLGISGVMYLALSIGILAGTMFWTYLIQWYNGRQAAKGKAKPEDRLFFLPVSTVIMAIALFWYGWSAEARVMWLMPEIGVFLYGFGFFMVLQSIQTYVIVLNTRLASSIIAAMVMGRSFMAATYPIFGVPMYNRLGYGWASTLVGLLALVLGLPAPIYIYLNGERLRAWSAKNSPVK